MLSITILFLECILLYSFSSAADNSQFLFFLQGKADTVVLGNPFLYQDIPDQIHLELVLELGDDSSCKYHSHVSSFFMGICFMNYKPAIVNHKLVLYSSMSFLL